MRTLAIVIAVGTLAAPAQAAGDLEYDSIYTCLVAVESGSESLATCQGLQIERCIGEIEETRGNTGVRAWSLCSTAELGEWFSLWASMLEESLWEAQGLSAWATTPEQSLRAAQHMNSVFASFAEMQKVGAEKCLRPDENAVVPMEIVTKCIGETYGPALVEVLRAMRAAREDR